MIVCNICGHHNHAEQIDCDICHRKLDNGSKRATLTVPVRPSFVNDAGWERNRNTGATHAAMEIKPNDIIVLKLRNTQAGLILPAQPRIVLGRRDVGSREEPDIDLAPYDAFARGVSRVHVAICRNESTVAIVDLESSNGTYVNGKRLKSYVPRLLSNGDMLALGQLVMSLHFKEVALGVT